jgi:hypothetical protein
LLVGGGLLALFLLAAGGLPTAAEPAKDRAASDKATVGKPKTRTAARIIGKYLPVVPREPDCFLVRRAAGSEAWQRLERNNAAVSTGDTLAGLPGYHSEVQFDSGVRLKLWGDLPEFAIPESKGVVPLPILESVVRLHEPGKFDLDLTLDRGRIVLANQKEGGPARVRVRIENSRGGQEVWQITLPRRNAEVALERWGRYPPGVPFSRKGDRPGPETEVYLFVLQGQATVITGSAARLLTAPPGASLLIWSSRRGTLPGPRIKKLPQWATSRYPPFPRDLKKEEEDYLKRVRGATIRALHEFSVRMAGKELEAGLAKTLRSNNVTLRLLTVRTFGATDDLPHLIDCLRAAKAPGVRQSAVVVLRHWIALHAGNDLVLHEALIKQRGFTTGEADTVLELLHSFSARDRARPSTYSRLINYLRHNKLAIRQLAHWHLSLLVPSGLTIKYDPAGDTAQLRSGAAEWKKLIPEGTLPKPPKKTVKP